MNQFEQYQEEEGDICRVCRNGSTPDNQLSYPCRCSGSIKYIHKQCLLEWIQHSKSSSCELCGHPFRFTPIYSENAPEIIPLSELIMEAIIRLKWYIKRFARILYIIFCWLFIVPVLTSWIFNFYFGSKWFLSNQNRNEFTALNLFYDFFIGTMLFFWIVLATVFSYIILDFLHHKHSEMELTNDMNQIQQLQQQLAQAQQTHQQAQEPQNVDEGSEEEDSSQYEEPLPNNFNVNDVYNQMLNTNQQQNNQQQQQQPPQPGEPGVRQQPRVLFRIPGVIEMLRFQDVDEPNQNNNNQQQAQPAQANNNVNNNNNNNDVVNGFDDDNNDDIEHFIGLSGPLSNIITNCIILILFNGVFIVLFLYCPYLLGQHILNGLYTLTNHSLKFGTFSEGAVNIVLGYTILSIFSLIFLSFLIFKNVALKFTVLLYSFIKVIVITVVELGLLPIFIGGYIDYCSFGLFGINLESRIQYFTENKIPFLLTRWGFGIFFMLNFTYLLSTLHQIFRKGVLWFVRDPDDPDFDLVKDMIKSSFKRHLYKISFTVFAYVLASTLLVYLPAKFLSYFTDLLPINIDFGEPIDKSTCDVFFIYAVSYFPRVDTRVTIKNLVKIWVHQVASFLELDGYLLPQNAPMVPVDQQGALPSAQPLTKPDNFGLRVSVFIFLGWFSLFLTVSGYLAIPVSVGRFFLHSVTTNDIYNILLGLIIGWIFGKLFYLLLSNGSTMNFAQWSFLAAKIIFLAINLLVILPILTGILLDLIFFTPITTAYDETIYFNSHEKYKILFQYWCYGSFILQIWYRCVTASQINPNNIRNNRPEDLETPKDKWVDRFDQLKRNGFANVDVKFTMMKIIFPITHYLLTLFTVPYCISKFVVPLFGGTLVLESITFRYGFPVYCFILIAERLLLKIKSWIILFHNIIRDDKYLIGKHLHNLDEQQQLLQQQQQQQSSSSNHQQPVY